MPAKKTSVGITVDKRTPAEAKKQIDEAKRQVDEQYASTENPLQKAILAAIAVQLEGFSIALANLIISKCVDVPEHLLNACINTVANAQKTLEKQAKNVQEKLLRKKDA